MKCLFASLCLLIAVYSSSAQKISFSLSTGPLIPAGQNLKKSFSLGWGLGVDTRIHFKKINLIPGIEAGLYANNSSSHVKDNFLLSAVQVKGSYAIDIGKFVLEPLAGVGFGYGTEFASNRKADFTGGYFSNKVNLMNFQGLHYTVGFLFNFSQRFGAGLSYKINRLKGKPTTKAQSLMPYNGSTALYGPVTEYPMQEMNLDNVSVNLVVHL